MKNNNKLTLKSLQQELERIKAAKTSSQNNKTDNSAIGHDIKDSYIQRLYMRSSGMWLFLITGILGYAHKIPIIRKVLAIIGFWYGKSSWWKILIKIRKMFILFNALIGVIVVFKTVGFSTDNLIAGFTAMGHSYFELLHTFTRRLFDWFIGLFDYKIVPNLPGNPPINSNGPFSGSSWNPVKGVTSSWPFKSHNSWELFNETKLDGFSLRDLYTKPTININLNTTPWYKDWSTLLWIGGSIVGVGVAYLGYKLFTDPMFFHSILGSKPTITHTGPTPPINPADNLEYSPDTTPTGSTSRLGEAFAFISGSVINSYKTVVYKLNPFNWVLSSSEAANQFDRFMETQNNMNTANRKLYPFTSDNPYNSWFKKLRIHYLGETPVEITERISAINYADRAYDHIIKVQDLKGKGVDRGASTNGLTIWSNKTTPVTSPALSSIGLPLPEIGEGLVERINYAQAQNTATKIASLPSSPSTVFGAGNWLFHSPELTAEIINADTSEIAGRISRLNSPNINQSTEIPATPNKYSVLEVE